MSEHFDDQAALPLFHDRTVSYIVNEPDDPIRVRSGESLLRTIEVPVEDIATLDDPGLREALWNKFKSDSRDDDTAVFVFAYPNGRLSHSYGIPRHPLVMPSALPTKPEQSDGANEVLAAEDSLSTARRLWQRVLGQ